MDLQTRKLNVIEYLIGLQDESLFDRIESIIIKSRKKTEDKQFRQFTEDELIERAQQSNKNYLEGKFKSQEQLEKESESW
jgi:hypothetical protein